MDAKINGSFDALLAETSFYLNYMKRRADVEERVRLIKFAEELLKLVLKSEEGEKDLHRGTAQSTLKTTWGNLKQDSLRIAEAHRNAALQMRKDVVDPLQAFRDSQERSKRRVAEQLRSCLDEHNTYKMAVQRFKRGYVHACDNVKSIQMTIEGAQNSAAGASSGVSSSVAHARDPKDPSQAAIASADLEDDSFSPPSTPRPSFDVISGITEGSLRDTQPPSATASAAARAQEALRTSRAQFTTLFSKLGNKQDRAERERDSSGDSGSSSAPAPIHVPPHDAVQSPKTTSPTSMSPPQSQSTFAASSSTVPPAALAAPSSFQGASSHTGASTHGGKEAATLSPQEMQTQTIRLVRAKNEAEKSDAEYRRSVIWLETLRLQKERVHRAAGTSVLEFVAELDTVMRDALVDYCEAFKFKTASVESYIQRTYAATQNILPEQDAASYAVKLPLDQALDPPVVYENVFFGPCTRLLFGISLADHAISFNPPRLVPRIVTQCIQAVENRLAEHPVEGIYRISPSMRKVQRLAMKVEADGDAFEFKPDVDTPLITALLKLYLRQLPTPLLPIPVNERLTLSSALMAQGFVGADEERLSGIQALAKRLRRLATPHQATLKKVVEHLDHVRLFEEDTKMDLTNLALVFSPCIFGDPDEVQLEVSGGHADTLLEALVIHNASLFEGLPIEAPARSRASSATPSLPPWQNAKSTGDDDEEFPLRKSNDQSKISHAANISRGLFTGMKRRASSAKGGGKNPASGTGDARPQSPLSLTRQHSNQSQVSLNAPGSVSGVPSSAASTVLPAVRPMPSPSDLEPDLQSLYAAYQTMHPPQPRSGRTSPHPAAVTSSPAGQNTSLLSPGGSFSNLGNSRPSSMNNQLPPGAGPRE